MMCSQCRQMFCWNCLDKLSKPSEHFHNSPCSPFYQYATWPSCCSYRQSGWKKNHQCNALLIFSTFNRCLKMHININVLMVISKRSIYHLSGLKLYGYVIYIHDHQREPNNKHSKTACVHIAFHQLLLLLSKNSFCIKFCFIIQYGIIKNNAFVESIIESIWM